MSRFAEILQAPAARLVLAAYAAAAAAMMLYPPFVVYVQPGRIIGKGYAPLWSAPHFAATVNIPLLLTQLLVLSIVAAAAFILLAREAN